MRTRTATDLSVEVFLSLCQHFYYPNETPKSFRLRQKRNTQDDPLDEYICGVLENTLQNDITVAKAPGPLVTPDMVIHRPVLCNTISRENLSVDSTAIIGLEVKKLQRGSSGSVARASGMDYNTTPPCGTIRIHDRRLEALDVRGFYLFVCQEEIHGTLGTYKITGLVLCDGNMLNEDFSYYLSVVGKRAKQIGQGTFGDGANRVRPMLIFANPLGAKFLDHNSTLIHPRIDLQSDHPDISRVGCLERTVSGDKNSATRVFHCYRDRSNHAERVQQGVPFQYIDPFPVPRRSKETVRRGRFIIDVCPPIS